MWLIFLSMSKNLPKLILDAAESFLNMCLFDFANMRGVRMFFFTYHCGSATTKTNGMNCEFRQKFLCFLDRFFFFDIFFLRNKEPLLVVTQRRGMPTGNLDSEKNFFSDKNFL